jgi:hypothetical protein
VSLPYRYELTLRVTVAGDGMHADGDGAMATAARLRELVRADDHVVEVTPLPANVRYLGKVENCQPPLHTVITESEPWTCPECWHANEAHAVLCHNCSWDSSR